MRNFAIGDDPISQNYASPYKKTIKQNQKNAVLWLNSRALCVIGGRYHVDNH